MASKADVLVIDDDAGMRLSISYVLQKAGFDCKEYKSGRGFFQEWDGEFPGCLVVDYQLPDMTGLSLIQDVRKSYEKLPFVLVTGYGTVAIAVEAMQLGAVTVIEKPFQHLELIEAVGNATELSTHLYESELKQKDLQQQLLSLTARERQVAALVADGNLTKQIAKSLGISTKTVEVHRSHITKKLGVSSVAQLVQLFLSASIDLG
jgi:two-component system response regulator TtrR